MAFIDVDVSVVASGELRPASTPVRLDREAVVMEDLHVTGSYVKAGEAVANIVEAPNQFNRAITTRALREVGKRLKSERTLSAAALLDAVAAYQHEVGSTLVAHPISAPATGVWITTTPLALAGPISSGGLLGTVHQFDCFTLRARLDGKGSAGIAPGYAVMARLQDGSQVAGTVIDKHQMASGTTEIEVQFRDPPQSLRAEWAHRLSAPEVSAVSSQSITIISGRQSLFSKLVLRR